MAKTALWDIVTVLNAALTLDAGNNRVTIVERKCRINAKNSKFVLDAQCHASNIRCRETYV